MVNFEIPIPPSIPNNVPYTPPQLPTESESESDDDSFDDDAQRLLPNSSSSLIYIKPHHRPFRDILFIFLYGLCFLVMMAVGMGNVFASASDIAFTKTLFAALWNNAGLLLGLSTMALVGALVWFVLLTKFTKVILMVTGLILPLFMFGLSVGSLASFLRSPIDPVETIEYKWMAIYAGLGTFGALFSAYTIWRRRKMILTLNVVIGLATEVLKANPNLFILSGLLTLAHALFSLLWLWMFAHIFLHAALVSTGDVVNIVLDPAGNIAVVFFLLMYFWTSSLLQNIEKTTVSSVVGEWYFENFETPISKDETLWHFKYVSSRSFGQMAFASLILGISRSINFLVSNTEKYAPRRFLSQRIIRFILDETQKFLNNISTYTLVHVGLTGESFLVSGYQCTKLFRRNLILGLATAGLSQLVSFLGKFLVASMIGYICFWNSLSFTHTGGEWMTAGVATSIAYYIMGLFTHVVETTIDASFICYLIDLDSHSCHNEKAHRVFSTALK